MNYNQNGDQFYYNITVRNDSAYTDSNIALTIASIPAGISFVRSELTQGSYNPVTRVWSIPSLPGKTVTSMKLWFEVLNTTLGPFTINYSMTGTLIDNSPSNNSGSLTATQTICTPDAGGNPDITSCLCIDVSSNDTSCTFGSTEWRLNPLTLVNGELQYWDEDTGQGGFTPIDPTLNITGTYDLWCVRGVEQFLKSSGVLFTIKPQLKNKNIFDHTISKVPFAQLSIEDKATLQLQYPTLILANWCWRVIRNGDGILTSGENVDCSDATDTKTFFFCTATSCTTPLQPCPCPTDELPVDITAQLPVGYSPEVGDTIYMQHPNAYSTWSFDGFLWNKWGCGCVSKISTDAGNLLTLGTDNSPRLLVSSLPASTAGCASINLFIPPFNTEVGVDAILHINGITNVSPLWNTWVWQDAGIYGPDTANLNPVWVDQQTGGTTYTLEGDDRMVRVVLANGSCVYYSNESGYENYLDITQSGGDISNPDRYDTVDRELGTIGLTLNVTTLFPATVVGQTYTYALSNYNTLVYEDVTLVGTTLTYSIRADAPIGFAGFINIIRTVV